MQISTIELPHKVSFSTMPRHMRQAPFFASRVRYMHYRLAQTLTRGRLTLVSS